MSLPAAAQKRLRLTLPAWRQITAQLRREQSSLSPAVRARCWAGAAMHSLLGRIQYNSFQAAIAGAVPLPPIFVAGFWRSGTTLLHELLCCDPRFGFPSTYACMNPSHFLLTEAWFHKRAGSELSRRPMDDVRYSWASPQEDEFALLSLGAPSPYQALLAPSLLRDPLKLVQMGPEDERAWGQVFQYFLRLLHVQQGKAMVLKSPPHGFRLAWIQAQYPEARYVVIERNPYEVFASNLKLWKTLLASYSLERSDESQVEEFILAAYRAHEEAVSRAQATARPGSWSTVRYEELEARPVEQVQRVYGELDLGEFEEARRAIEGYLGSVAGHQRNSFVLPPDQRARIERAWGDLIKAKGYEWPQRYIKEGGEAQAAVAAGA